MLIRFIKYINIIRPVMSHELLSSIEKLNVEDFNRFLRVEDRDVKVTVNHGTRNLVGLFQYYLEKNTTLLFEEKQNMLSKVTEIFNKRCGSTPDSHIVVIDI